MNKNQEAVNQHVLPPFNREINITIPVDEIYQELLREFPAEYKHREIVAHAIIGTAEQKGGLGYIFSALRGHFPEINFQVGDEVNCTAKDRRRRWNAGTDESPDYQSEDVEIGNCTIVEINLYASKKLKVKFFEHTYSGPIRDTETTEWVDVTTCTKWADFDYNRQNA